MACLRDTSAKVYATAVYLKQSSIEFYYITLISIFKDQAGPIKNNYSLIEIIGSLHWGQRLRALKFVGKA